MVNKVELEDGVQFDPGFIKYMSAIVPISPIVNGITNKITPPINPWVGFKNNCARNAAIIPI